MARALNSQSRLEKNLCCRFDPRGNLFTRLCSSSISGECLAVDSGGYFCTVCFHLFSLIAAWLNRSSLRSRDGVCLHGSTREWNVNSLWPS